MFGIRFIKVQPTDYLILYKRGQIAKEGPGLDGFYFAPTTSLVRIPLASVELPFIFNDTTSDYQQISIQGQLTYRIADPKKVSQYLDYTLQSNGVHYASEDPQKLAQRLVNLTQEFASGFIRQTPLRKALSATKDLVAALRENLLRSEAIGALGVEILTLSILAIKPTPETARALEADTRETILRAADEAVYSRRNAAVEQERAIKENELNTEIAIENKKRQIRETQMDAEKAVQQKQRELHEAEMAAKIALEDQNKALVQLVVENARQEADAKAYGVSAIMKAMASVDPKTLQALTSSGMEPSQLIALAFKEIAEGAERIGQLNISPELLRELLGRQQTP